MVDRDLQISGGAVIHGQTLSKRGGGGVNKIFFGPWGLSLVKNKQVDQNEHFSPFGLSSAAIKIGVWINSACLNNLGHEKFGFWTEPCL